MPYKKLFFVVAPLLFLILFLPQEGFPQHAANCLVCHSSMKGKLKTAAGALIELNVDTKKFESSVHGQLGCPDCHMKFADNPHSAPSASVPAEILSLSSKISGKYKVDPVAGASCMRCHEDLVRKVLASVHGRNITDKGQNDGALCVDCHGSPHYIVPAKEPASKIGRQQQVATCGKCHGDKRIIEKYRLEENVMESFQESFHGRKLHLGHGRAPVCASCHNSHDIKSKDDPSSPVFGNNKKETCGKCHKGANEKFIPAITHSKPGPIPHYTEKALIVLLLSVFTFIISHVVLEAFSDIRDAIFKKGRED